jgi:pilus assembly protein FimV
MSGPSKLSLAIALALIGGNAFALGLGSIQVKSGLNQPLNAEIPVSTESAAEANGLIVGLASAEDFTRVGLNRTRVSVPIDFAVTTDGRGQSIIKLTTKDIVREPFLDLLVEVNWPKGKLLREYTVLLDPPVTAPVRGSSATSAPAKEAAPAPAQKLAEEKQPKPKPTAVKPPRTVAAEAKPKPAPSPKAPAPAPSAAPKHVASAGDYGPVAEGETLSEVARATKPDDATNVNQMMLALLKNNPNAFYKDNINALKRGAILRIPSSDEIKSTGTSMAAAAAVRDQNASWSGNAAVAKPTVVANAGAPKSAAPPKPEKVAAAKPSEHLALVPPRAGKDSQSTADHPGPSTGTGTSAETKAELTRTKEALASREQEATELRSRVKQLEDLNGKDQRLLSLKESEIADLQNKLKQLQASKPATTATTTPPPTAAVTKPAETTPAPVTKPAETAAKPADTSGKTEPKLTAQDIWGDISATGKTPAAKPGTPATSATTPAPASTAPAAATPVAPTTTPSTTSPASSSTTAASTSATTPKSDATPSTTPSASTATTPTPTPATTSVTTTPVTTPVTSAPVSITANPPVKPATPAAKPTALPPIEQPWYQNNTALLAGGAGLLLIGLLALMRFMRKPKPVLMPVGPGEADMHAMSGEDEHHLLDALAQHPGDPQLSLELLSLYYAQHDAGKFEAAAEAMYAHISDPTQPEWQQVRAMGEQLCPHNPLFGGNDNFAGAATHAHEDHTGFGHLGDAHHEDAFDLDTHGAHDAKPSAEDNFDFDLTDHAAAGTVIPAHEMDFSQQTIVGHPTPPPAPPPPAFQAPPARVAPAPAPAPVAAKPAEDFFAGEDAIGTKLDLAKAYLDMGDPEGARSMLDEVMAEGNDAQKGEARKLLAEIR